MNHSIFIGGSVAETRDRDGIVKPSGSHVYAGDRPSAGPRTGSDQPIIGTEIGPRCIRLPDDFDLVRAAVESSQWSIAQLQTRRVVDRRQHHPGLKFF